MIGSRISVGLLLPATSMLRSRKSSPGMSRGVNYDGLFEHVTRLSLYRLIGCPGCITTHELVRKMRVRII